MPVHAFSPPEGQLEFFETEGHLLLENLLGDPTARTVGVYVPQACRPGERYPLLIDLAGFTGSGLSHLARTPSFMSRSIRWGSVSPNPFQAR